MNKLFLDSANLEEIQEIVDNEAISGVTTNPSLISKEQKTDYKSHLIKIAKLLKGTGKHLSVEVITLDEKEMFEQAVELNDEIGSIDHTLDLAIKIPISLKYLNNISKLEEYGINVNATACMTYGQYMFVQTNCEPTYISFFYNRMKDAGIDAKQQLLSSCLVGKEVTQTICGSIRKPEDIIECWDNGADIVTASLKIIKELVEHPKTIESISGFQKDIETWLK